MSWKVLLYQPSHGRIGWHRMRLQDTRALGAVRRIELLPENGGPGETVRLPVFGVKPDGKPPVRWTLKFRLRCPIAGVRGRESVEGVLHLRGEQVQALHIEEQEVWPREHPSAAPADRHFQPLLLKTRFAKAAYGMYDTARRNRSAGYRVGFRLRWERSREDSLAGGAWVPVLTASYEGYDRVEPWVFTTRYTTSGPLEMVQVPADAVLSKAKYEEALGRDRSDGDFRQGWLLRLKGLAPDLGREIWNRFVDDYVGGIELAAGEPASFLPRILSGAPSWTTTYLLVDRDGNDDESRSWLEEPRYRLDGLLPVPPEEENEPGSPDRAPRRMELRTLSMLPEISAEPGVDFPLVRTHSGSPLRSRMTLSAEVDRSLTQVEQIHRCQESHGILLPIGRMVLSGEERAAPRATRQLRMGALDLVVASSRPPKGRGQILLIPRHPYASDRLLPRGVRSFGVAGLKMELTLAVAAVEPGGQDESDGRWTGAPQPPDEKDPCYREDRIQWLFSRPAPLVVAQPDATGTPSETRAQLEIEEKRGNVDLDRLLPPLPAAEPRPPLPWDIRKLELRLKRVTESNQSTGAARSPAKADPCRSATDGAIVLDGEPFLVALVRYPSLTDSDSSDTNEIARWTYDGFGRPSWRLLLGPRPTCLQLPPQGVGEEMERYKENGGAGDGETFGFRFSPPARLGVRESDFERNYPEAPWNLRRLFSNEWEESPGVVVESMEYELLYGLLCHDPEDPAKGSAFLRMADLVAVAGPVPGPMAPLPRWRPHVADAKPVAACSEPLEPSLREYLEAREDWAETVDQLQARLAMLEVWNPHSPLQLRRRLDVECRLRTSAQLATVADGCDGDLLCGGALYGVEPPPVYQALDEARKNRTRRARSSEAFVDDLRFSSLGGSGLQTAEFLDGLVTLIAEVEVGRVHMLRVEILGRIGCWWNRARYVVVYRRLPGPTLQFEDYQDPHQGRMVLRKAEEFVETLEEKRRYPDDARAAERHTGCVEACTFEDNARFNVLSLWGETVGERGWKIPIWRRDATPADLYPEPQVALSLFSNVDGESRPAPCTLANPENLYFYTEVPEESGDDGEGSPPAGERVDPSRWAPVVGVDLVDEAKPQARPDFANGNKTPVSSPDVAVPPGHDPCTFRLHPAPFPTDVAAFRGRQPLGARLSTLTMSRAALAKAVEDAPKHLGEKIATHTRALEGLVADISSADPEEIRQKVEDRIHGICSALDAVEPKRIEEQAAEHLDTGSWLGELRKEIDARVDWWFEEVPDLQDPADAVEAATREVLARHRSRALPLARGYLKTFRHALDSTKQTHAKLLSYQSQCEAALAWAEVQLAQGSPEDWIRNRVEQRLRAVVRNLQDDLAALEEKLARGPGLQVRLDGEQVLDKLTQQTRPLAEKVAELARPKMPEATDLRQFLEQARNQVLEPVRTALHDLDAEVLEKARILHEGLHGDLARVEETLDALPRSLADRVPTGSPRRELVKEIIHQGLEDLVRSTPLEQATQKARSHLAEASDRLTSLKSDAKAACNSIRGKISEGLDELEKEIRSRIGELESAIQLEVTRSLAPVYAQADGALRTLRAFGKPPEVEGLGFDRPEIAYFFDEYLPEIDVTPVLGRAAQAASLAGGLKPLGIDLPTIQLTDKLLPPELQDFDVSSILPDVAGVDLSGLFPDFKVPNGSQVDVKHGLDPETRRGWVQADFHAGSTGPRPIFSTGALSIVLRDPKLAGTARMEGQVGGAMKRRVEGNIKGDWEIVVGGRSLVRFPDTTLYFDGDGDVRFDLRPELMQLDQTLEFVQNLLESLVPGDGSAFRIEPTGVVAELCLPLPNLQGGTFGITNLVLGSQIALRHTPEFAIEAGFNLGRPLAPFTLSVFILGGAGYLTTRSRYLPATGEVEAQLDMAIAASASLALSLGPIDGGVYVYFGVNAHYRNQGALDVGLFVLVRGHVSILGIASATICLQLAVTYNQDNSLTATGRLSVRIKICWCFTLEVDRDVTYDLGAAGGEQAARLALPGATVRLAQAGTVARQSDICPPLDPEEKNLFHQRVREYLRMVT